MLDREFDGVLFIGDPHTSSRAVEFRKDDFGRTVLGKLSWCLSYAEGFNLLPVILGDLFERPRDNANWLLGELLELFAKYPVVGIYGNHDCYEDKLGEHDSLDVLISAGRYRLLSPESPWRGQVCGKTVAVYGQSWRLPLPASLLREDADDYVILVTHHDFIFPGIDAVGYLKTNEISGVDLVVNGHLHRPLEPHTKGATRWMNPGNITRVKRGDATKSFVPQVVKLDWGVEQWEFSSVTVPHEPYDAVFYEAVLGDEKVLSGLVFVRGLGGLQARRTESGAALREFLELNLDSYEPETQVEIRKLADIVLADRSAGTPEGEI